MMSAVSYGTLALVAWGALSFGAVYPWAYWPLMAGTIVCAAGWWKRGASADLKARPLTRASPRAVSVALVAGMAAIGVAALLQLVPLPRAVLATMSPATDAFLDQYDIVYATQHEASHTLSIRPESSWLGLAILTILSLFLFSLARGLTKAGPRTLAAGLVGLGVLLAVIGIVQNATFTGKIYGFWEPFQFGLTFGPFVNRNHFAGWMMMTLSVSLGYFGAVVARGIRGVKPGWRERVLWLSSPDANRAALVGAATAVMGLSLVMTLSRSGITCFVLALTLTGLTVVRRQRSGLKRVVATTYLVVLFGLSAAWVGPDTIARRFVDVANSGRIRVEIWNNTVEIAQDFPMVGTGLNTYGTAMLLYQSVQLNRQITAAHNDYLQLVSEGGLLLGIPIVVTLGLFVRELRKRFLEGRDDETTYWIRVGAVTGLIAIAFQEIGEFSLQMPGNALLFTVLAAMAIHRGGVAEVQRSGGPRSGATQGAGRSD